MSRKPRETVNSSVDLCPEVQAIAQIMGTDLSTRDLIILASIEQMIITGPVDFNSGTVCDLLNLKHPMVNYYFGSRDGLIAEAAIWTYRGWSSKAIGATRNAPRDPEKRLGAYLVAGFEWAGNMQAMTLLSQYPVLSQGVRSIIDEGYSIELQKDFEFHIVFLATLIIDLRKGKISELDFDQTNYPKAKYMLSHPRELLDAASVAWAGHGVNLWNSGSHIPTRNLRQDFTAKVSERLAVDVHLDNIVAIARGQK